MLTAEDKKFILVAINDAMVKLAGATADLIEGVSAQIKEVRNDVSFLKHQAIHTNKSLGFIREDLAHVHKRVDYLEQVQADRVNDALDDPNSGTD